MQFTVHLRWQTEWRHLIMYNNYLNSFEPTVQYFSLVEYLTLIYRIQNTKKNLLCSENSIRMTQIPDPIQT